MNLGVAATLCNIGIAKAETALAEATRSFLWFGPGTTEAFGS
jgi:hypothetical protein